MSFMVASTAALVLAVLAALHVYWAFGGELGKVAVIPEIHGERAFNPSPVATLLVAGALLVATAIVLGRAGAYGAWLQTGLFKWPTLLLGIAFFARAVGDLNLVGFTKRIRGTAFARWDSALFSPLCLVLGLALGWLALR